MSLLLSIPFILIALVTHEAWGHKLIAEKVLGLKPQFIAIGMPLKIGKLNTVFYTWNRPGKVPVVFSWLLIGGGVGFEDAAYYSVGNYWKKILMILAGPAVNMLLSFVLVAIFSNPSLAANLIWSYGAVTLEIIKSIFTSITVEQALNTHQFFDLTLQLAQLTQFWQPIAYFALWNVSIGVMNLLPIPGLDGGQILGISIINIFGEKTINPVKTVNQVFYYLLLAISTAACIWWIVTLFL